MGQGGQCSVLGTEGPPPPLYSQGTFSAPSSPSCSPPRPPTATWRPRWSASSVGGTSPAVSTVWLTAMRVSAGCCAPGGGWWWRGVGGLWLHSHPPHTHSPRLGCGGGQIPACRCSGLRVFGSLRVLGEGVRLRCCPPTRGGGSWPVPSHHPWGDWGGGGFLAHLGSQMHPGGWVVEWEGWGGWAEHSLASPHHPHPPSQQCREVLNLMGGLGGAPGAAPPPPGFPHV